MAKALVIGGKTGLLGQSLMKSLALAGWETAALGRDDGDLLDLVFLRDVLQQADADVVFNTVAWTQVDDAEDNEEDAREINRVFPDALARTIGNMPTGHLVHYSTDFVFSDSFSHPWREEDPPYPASVYGATKLEGENAVLKLLPERSCVLRTAWLFGPGRKNFVQTILNAARGKDSLTVVDDQLGSPTYACDLADWSVKLADKRVKGIWHTVNSGQASWCELATEAVALASLPCKIVPISSAQWPQKAKRPHNSTLDNSKLGNFLGKKPRPWPQALRDYVYGNLRADDKGSKS